MSDRRRVLMVSREFPPSIGPHPIRVAKLAKYLTEFGWDPTIMSVPVDHVVDRDYELASETDEMPIVRVSRLLARVAPPSRGSRTLEVPGPTMACPSDAPARAAAPPAATPPTVGSSTAGPKLKSRLAGALLLPDSSVLWALPAARRAAAMADAFDAIFTTAPPFSTHLIGDRVARSRHLAWVAEYRDNWTVNPLYRRAAPIQWLNGRLERRCLAAAGAVVVVSDAAAAELRGAFPAIASRLYVAPNGYDPDDLPEPAPRPALFEITYAGSLDERRDPRPFLAALAGLMAASPQAREAARLRLIGRVAGWVVEAAAASIGPERVTFDGLLPHRETLARASRAAVLLGITTSAEAGGAGYTSKLFEYLGLQRPILMLAPAGPARDLVTRSGGGLVADPEDVPAISAALGQLFDEWSAGSERRGDATILDGLTRRATARAVAEALDAAVALARRRPC
jgi:glycosyltransferase involved in cell wall biosynthesis